MNGMLEFNLSLRGAERRGNPDSGMTTVVNTPPHTVSAAVQPYAKIGADILMET